MNVYDAKEYGLTEQQAKFCTEWVIDYNTLRAYSTAYPNTTKGSAYAGGCRLLKDVKIQAFIKVLKEDIAATVGISKIKVLRELSNIAFSSVAHLHNTWIQQKEFDELTDEQKACIEEISTRTEQRFLGDGKESGMIETKWVKLKLHDKLKAIESINKIMGWNEPEKTTSTISLDVAYDLSKISTETLREILNAANKPA